MKHLHLAVLAVLALACGESPMPEVDPSAPTCGTLSPDEACVTGAASRLGLGKADFIRDSYYYLYIKHCQERGISPGNMVFPGNDLPGQAE